MNTRGIVSNLLFENFYIEGAAIGPNINQDSGNNGKQVTLGRQLPNLAYSST